MPEPTGLSFVEVLTFFQFILSFATLLVLIVYASDIWKLRKAAELQTDVMIDQISISQEQLEVFLYKQEAERRSQTDSLLEQLRLSQEQLEILLGIQREERRQIELAGAPAFTKAPGQFYGPGTEIPYINEGGTIRRISVEPAASFSMQVRPSDYIATDGRALFTFWDYDHQPDRILPFTLRYIDFLGHPQEKKFAFRCLDWQIVDHSDLMV